MAVTRVLDLQRRSQQIGRIRIGQQVPTGGKDRNGNPKMRPAKLDTFRLTTGSRMAADAIAEQLGGEVREWVNRGRKEWEVVTGVSELRVTVPPRDAVIGQAYEMWTAGGCARRCDSQREQISGGPCLCPHAEDPTNAEEVAAAALERAELAKRNPPQACKLVTRLNVQIPDLPGLGVFRLDTGSFYAAGELIDQAQLMEMARAAGVFLPAILRIEQRQRVANGQTKNYPVPVLELLTTFRAIATGQLEHQGIAAQLPPAPGEQRRAITSGRPAQQAPASNGQQHAPASPAAPAAKLPQSAQEVANLARGARTRARLRPLFGIAKENDWGPDNVCTSVPGEEPEAWEELGGYLEHRWNELPDDQPKGQQRQQAAAPAAEQSGSLFDDDSWPEEP